LAGLQRIETKSVEVGLRRETTKLYTQYNVPNKVDYILFKGISRNKSRNLRVNASL
jgi:hypothetical protein